MLAFENAMLKYINICGVKSISVSAENTYGCPRDDRISDESTIFVDVIACTNIDQDLQCPHGVIKSQWYQMIPNLNLPQSLDKHVWNYSHWDDCPVPEKVTLAI